MSLDTASIVVQILPQPENRVSIVNDTSVVSIDPQQTAVVQTAIGNYVSRARVADTASFAISASYAPISEVVSTEWLNIQNKPSGLVSSSTQTIANINGQEITPSIISSSGHIVPSTTEIYDLGSTDLRWRDLYLSGSTIYLGNAQISSQGGEVTITNTVGASLPLSGSFTGSFIGDASALTGVISSSFATTASYAENAGVSDWNELTNVPSGLVSSSTQITITESQISDLIHYTDSDVKTKLNTEGVISSSAQITITESQISDLTHYTDSDVLSYINSLAVQSGSDTPHYTDSDVLSYINTLSVVSSSAQIDHDQTTNYAVNEHFTQANITTVGTVTTGDVSAILPAGTVSSSTQITITESQISDLNHYDNADNLSYLNSLGVISSSAQITITESQISDLTHYQDVDTLSYINSLGVFSASAQVDGSQVTGVVSSSYALTASYSLNGGGGGGSVTSVTAGAGLNGGEITTTGTISVDSGSMLPYYSSSIFTTISGDGTIDSAGVLSVVSSSYALTASYVEGAASSWNTLSDKPDGLVSSSIQVDHDATTNYDANEHFTQANITTVGTVTTGDVSAILPAGTVSSSTQITITESQISDLIHYQDSDVLTYINSLGVQSGSDTPHYTDSDNLTYLNSLGVISSSAQITITESQISDLTHYQDTDTLSYINSLSVVSASAQIDHDQTTNYAANEHFTQADITTVGTVTTGDVSAILPTGTISSSTQFTDPTNPFSGSFSGSFYGEGTNLNNLSATGSFQGTFVGDGSGLTGVVAASSGGITIWNADTPKGNAEILNFGSGFDAQVTTATASINLIGGIVSSSVQINADSITNFDSNVLTYINSLGSVSSSAQIDHDQTVNYDVNEHFTQANITTVGTVTTGDVSAILPTGTVSSSTQITITESQISDLNHYDNADNLTYLNSLGVFSSSAQVNADTVTNFDSNVLTYVNSLDVVSASVQIDHDQTTNYDVNEHFTQANITTVGTVTTGDVSAILPTGTVSSSTQITITESQISDLTHYQDSDVLTYINSLGVQSGSDTPHYTDSDTLSYINSLAVVSSSAQIDHDATTNYDASEHFTQANITTVGTVTTGNVDAILPAGTVSSSTQITITESQISDLTHYQDTDTLSYINSLGVFSASAQVNADTVTNFDPNVLTYINSLAVVSASAQIDHDQTTNYDASEHFTQENITTVGTVTAGDVSAILPVGTVSSSTQITITESQISDLNHYDNADNLTYLNSLGVFSASAQVNADSVTNFDSNVLTYVNSLAVVSASAQIDHDATTNYDVNEHFTQANITTVGTVTTGDVSAILPTGTLSSSAQIDGSQVTGVISSSYAATASYVEGAASSWNTLSDKPDGLVSSSIQVDHDATTNYDANEHFTQANITTVGTVTTGDVSAILPVGTVSSSTQITITESQISDLNHYDNADNLTYLNSLGVFSASAQVNADSVTNFDSNVLTYVNSLAVVSASAQIDHDQTTNYAANEHFTQANITTVGTVTTGDVSAILPTGTVSSSTQITITESQISDLTHYQDTDTLTYINSLGVFSASAQVNADTVTNFDSNVLTYINSLGSVSSSAQIDHDQTTNYDANEHFTQANITTVGTVTTGNVDAILPAGTVSSSTQITITESQISDLTHYQDADTLTYINSLGVFSASAQVNADSITNFDSNILTYVNSLAVVSASAQIDHDATTNYDVNEHFTQANITTVGTVTTGDVSAILPAGTVSSSTQITITESQISDLTHYQDSDTLSYINSLAVVSASAQIDHDQTTNYDASEHFTQANITTVGTVTTGDVSAILPTGTVSSSTQITITESQISDLTHYQDTDTLTYINSLGVFSASAQVNADSVTNFDPNVLTYINSLAVVSSSAQIDHDQTTNYDANEHFTQANITTVGTVTTGDVSAILPTGTVSSSTQFSTLTDPFSGSFTGSFTGDGSGLTGVGAGFTWNAISANTTGSVDNGYIISNTGTEVHLPSTAAVGSTIRFTGITSDYRVSHPDGVQIRMGQYTTTTGTGGITSSLASGGDSLELVCVTANTTWFVISSVGSFTLV
ncbi:MAG: hypothetical protein VW683_00545 [Betaproteobacteria bacterium]|jgi:ribosomal protein S8E